MHSKHGSCRTVAISIADRHIHVVQRHNATRQICHVNGGEWGKKFPTVVGAWRRVPEKVIPFFAFPPEVRRVIYTTNSDSNQLTLL